MTGWKRGGGGRMTLNDIIRRGGGGGLKLGKKKFQIGKQCR